MTHDPTSSVDSQEILFSPFALGSLKLSNRIVMAPMTRGFSPGGVPGADVAAYYRRRAEGGVGLIITEGTWVPHVAASNNPRAPRFYGEDALSGWRQVVREVHAAGGRIMPQLWHVGMVPPSDPMASQAFVGVGPSDVFREGQRLEQAMTQNEIDEVAEAFVVAAVSAKELGFDGVEIHAAHGYLIDQFFWGVTNRRHDRYGGGLKARTRFAVEIVEEMRRRVGADFPICLRFSQWKQQNYEAKLALTPAELEQFLEPLAEAGVDIFHCSTRRFWLPEFAGSHLNLAGWTKKITGKPVITVGSVTLDQDFTTSVREGGSAEPTGLEPLLQGLEREEFDLVAIGRSLIVNPEWPQIIKSDGVSKLRPFTRDALASLV